MSSDPVLISVTDAARMLGVSKFVAYRLAKREDFPAVTIGERILVHRVGLENWIDEQVANHAEVELS